MMTWQKLLEPEIQKFILAHQNEDVHKLALKKSPGKDWDYPRVLGQIKARQKAKRKIPQWLDYEAIVFPPADILEQASSAATALYKARLVSGKVFTDLTGGCGVDSWAFAHHFQNGTCVEQNADAFAALAYNLPKLCSNKIVVKNADAETAIRDLPKTNLIFVDPQRRDQTRKGKFKFEECSPNIIPMLPELLDGATKVMIKTSPMLDISEGIEQLGSVEHVHVVEWNGECKELLFILSKISPKPPEITAVSIDDNGEILTKLTFTQHEEHRNTAQIGMPEAYLYEPSPAFQKSGAFNTISTRYDVRKLHVHTHLYTGNALIKGFPGRTFKILGQYPAQKGKIPLDKANISVRNFPSSPEALRKKLKIKDGGNDYIFACTLYDGSKTLLHCQKI